MTRTSPMPDISIGKLTHYTAEGEPDYAQYEIEVSSNIECCGIITLDYIEDLLRLRNAIDSYLSENNLNPSVS